MKNKDLLHIYCIFIGFFMGFMFATLIYTNSIGIANKFINDKEYKIDTLKTYNSNHLEKIEYKFVLKK